MLQLYALFITLAIEGPIVFAGFFRRHSLKKSLVLAYIPTLLSHPFLWMASSSISSSKYYYWSITGLEILVVLVEGLILKFISKENISYCLVLSFLANAVSTLLGLALWEIFS